MKRLARFATAAGMVIGLIFFTATSAYAHDENWLWEKPGGNNIGVGAYQDSGDWMLVNDQDADGHSVLLDVWKQGEPDGIHIRCWDSRGAGAEGWVGCSDAFAGSGWGANATLRGKLCRGEAGPGSGGGRIVDCQPSSEWKSFYR